MKKATKRALALLLTALMLLAMTACGGASSGSSNAAAAPEVGKYAIYEVKSDDVTINGDMLKTLGMDTSSLELRADGTASMTLVDESTDNMTWGDGKLTADGESIDYKYDDGFLTISLDSEQITFKKS